MPALEEGHGAHPQEREPAGAGVPGDVVGRYGRAGQHELAGKASIVDGPTHVVPQAWLDLPFVDQPRDRTIQHESWVHRSCSSGVLVDVQQARARHSLTRGLRLAGRLGSLDDDGAGSGEASIQLGIDDSGQVGHLQAPTRGQSRDQIVGIPTTTL